MSEYHPLSPQRHGQRSWSRFTGYAFAATDAVCPLVMHEIPNAALSMPTAFVRQDHDYALVAVQGLEPGRNLFVGPAGHWLGGYIPAFYRSYPFRLVPLEDAKAVLCVDEASGLVSDHAHGGEPFFAADGELARPVVEVRDFLAGAQRARLATATVCATLAKLDLLRAWPLQLKMADGGESREVQGLFCVNETALNALPADALVALRDSGALAVAYTQLLSMQQLPKLGRLLEMHAGKGGSQASPLFAADDLDLGFLNWGDTLSFSDPH